MERLSENGCSNEELKEILTHLSTILDDPSHFPGDDSDYLASIIFSLSSSEGNELNLAITEIKEKLKSDNGNFQANKKLPTDTAGLDVSSSVLTLAGSFKEVAIDETSLLPAP